MTTEMNFQPGTYYQDILEDGSHSVIRQNFPELKRTSFDKRPPVVQTMKITVENLIEEPLLLTKEVEVIPEIVAAQEKMGLHLNPDSYRPVYDSMGDLNPKEDREELLEKFFGKIEAVQVSEGNF